MNRVNYMRICTECLQQPATMYHWHHSIGYITSNIFICHLVTEWFKSNLALHTMITVHRPNIMTACCEENMWDTRTVTGRPVKYQRAPTQHMLKGRS